MDTTTPARAARLQRPAEPDTTTDLLSIGELHPETLRELLDLAEYLTHDPRAHGGDLTGRIVTAIFDKPSTRTRVSIAGAVARLGGQCQVLRPDELQLGRGETIEDTARVLGSYAAAVTIRTFEHDTAERFAAACDVPVINALTDLHHPLQALADLLTIRQAFGALRGLQVAWLGDGNNVAHSLMEACAMSGCDIVVATPVTRRPDPDVVARARAVAKEHGGSVMLVDEPADAAAGAHVVYTDVWSSMGETVDAAALREQLQRFQVDRRIMAMADPDAIFLHCLPAHRGEEVTADVIDGLQSQVFRQAANRLPTAQAVIQRLVDNATRRSTRRP